MANKIGDVLKPVVEVGGPPTVGGWLFGKVGVLVGAIASIILLVIKKKGKT